MISTEEALAGVLSLLAPTRVERAPLAALAGRTLAEAVIADRAQPAFDASSMDGYAVRADDARKGARLRVIGEAPAGRAFAGAVGPGEAVQLFTGAPVPDGADAVLIQEDADRDGDALAVREAPSEGANIRRRGRDFAPGDRIEAPRRLGASDVALIAAMNRTEAVVRRPPRVALIPTGDELVEPGGEPGPDAVIASTHYGLAALLAAHGAAPSLRPIARDRAEDLRAALEAAAASADLVVTLGGASVGAYDLVQEVIGAEALAFYKVAMRPGKPLMAGRFSGVPVVGLPGNPVSAMVCGHVFLRPALDRMLGLPAGPLPRVAMRLAAPIGPNGPREHYMRARAEPEGLRVFEDQDSARMRLLAEADALVVRAPRAPAAAAGATVEAIPLRAA